VPVRYRQGREGRLSRQGRRRPGARGTRLRQAARDLPGRSGQRPPAPGTRGGAV